MGRHVVISILFLLVSCDGGGSTDSGDAKEQNPWFRDITRASGIEFSHEVLVEGAYPLREVMGPGCAVLDVDGDDLLDIYFLNSGAAPEKGAANQLFRRRADGTYENITEKSGLGDVGYGTGVAVGDVDNDGDLDVYVGNDGRDRLYINQGDGTFVDGSDVAGIVGKAWTTSVAFLDFDVDGWLDIFVVHYLEHDGTKVCSFGGKRDYCSPTVYPGVADVLYRNRGDGTFQNVSDTAGIHRTARHGLGVVVEDFDGDGRPDIYVANDMDANQLWLNRKNGKGRLVDEAATMGVAVNGLGAAEASMGVACGSVTGALDVDLFMTHLRGQTNTLYVRSGDWGFEDKTQGRGLATHSLSLTGFGTELFDVDNDGDLDIALVNGRVNRGKPVEGARGGNFWRDYAEPNQLFLNENGKFRDVSPVSGRFHSEVEVSRGMVAADLDNDGDLDIVVSNCGGPARVYENVTPGMGGFVKVRVRDEKLHRDVYGARVMAQVGWDEICRTVSPARSYMSSSAVELHFGVGDASSVTSFEVTWPGGGKESFDGCPVGSSIVLVRGRGRR